MRKPAPDNVAQVILDSISDGVFTVDLDWRITYFNRAAAEITQVPQEEALGRFCWEVFRANICERECALKRTLETGCPVINKAVYIVNAAGERVPISISTAALKDGSGRVIGGVETFRDLSQVEELRRELYQKYSFMDIIGKSPPMQKLFSLLPDIAASDATVLIEGPTGSGKELVARAIHNLSPRRHRPFIAFNCAALPDTLLESELFGYKAGAFTGAAKDKPGRFALAQGGTIFLDEIGDVSPLMQVKLLRVLQEKEYEPLGAVAPVKADVRILAATNKDLASLVEQGLFREDLYYRLNVIKVTLPSLAARKEDLPLLVDHFLARLNALRGKAVEGLSEEAWRILWGYHFPGNVRELQNILEHAYVLCKGGLITPEHLPSYLHTQKRDQCRRQPLEGGTLAEVEAQAIYEALLRHKGNRTRAARELGIDKTTLWRKMKRYGIKVPSVEG
ncbi:sigma-54 interaction domain-containing protein [Desulfovirgula thermocuniculi]|uniref:sigma-54 interaction domain-containing protein n=1 Tax=Desulfovirgula thermocuniculi TaxID=348842 RepID=UPI000419F1CB|nr:sigma-54-dependent Fis family transcriptional regulator [Desulfovirgula thermocuniculi]